MLCDFEVEQLDEQSWQHTCKRCGCSTIQPGPKVNNECCFRNKAYEQCSHRGKFLVREQCATCYTPNVVSVFECEVFGACALRVSTATARNTCEKCGKFTQITQITQNSSGIS